MPQELTTYTFWALAFAAPWLCLWAYIRRLPFTTPQSILYFLATLLTRLLWRTQLSNRLELPASRGALLICNHRSSIDPFFIQTTLLRQTHWLVAKEYCQHPALKWFLKQTGVIPVNRGGVDTAAMKVAIRTLSSGGLVGVFPEGRLNQTDQFMLPVRPGAILIALKAKVPIIPCFIEGSPFREAVWSPLFMPARVRVRFGRPIEVERFAVAGESREAMNQLMDRAVREIAALAGHPDFEPRFAGKDWKTAEHA